MQVKTNLHYLAGFFDGEGSIFVWKKKYLYKERKTINYELKITVTNTNKEILQAYKSLFGGYICKKTLGKLNKRVCYSWVIAARQTKKFMKAIYPYVFVKKEQVKLGIEFQKKIRQRGLPGVSAEELERRRDLRERISNLNHGN